MAVYSRRPLGDVTLRELGHQRVPVIRASLAVGERDVALYAVHVFPPVSRRAAAWRNHQFREIGQQVRREGGPVVVTGDLNCTSWSPFFRRLLAETGLRDSRRGFGVEATWPTHVPWMLIPIDHCLVSPGLQVVGRHVTDSCGSDHLGIVVDLRAGT
jgi:endonuclease/exonuclease/phosphatase (EEP) superfamily protein YafD